MDEIKHGFYRHYKGGLYYVRGIVTHTETKEEMVLYQETDEPFKWWARPIEMWNDSINGKPQFEYLGTNT